MEGKPKMMHYTKIAGYNVDPIDVSAGMDMLLSCGYDEMYTEMVIQYALTLWSHGEEALAEKNATDQSFYGIDYTSWRMVLAAAIAEGTRKLNGSASIT